MSYNNTIISDNIKNINNNNNINKNNGKKKLATTINK